MRDNSGNRVHAGDGSEDAIQSARRLAGISGEYEVIWCSGMHLPGEYSAETPDAVWLSENIKTMDELAVKAVWLHEICHLLLARFLPDRPFLYGEESHDLSFGILYATALRRAGALGKFRIFDVYGSPPEESFSLAEVNFRFIAALAAAHVLADSDAALEEIASRLPARFSPPSRWQILKAMAGSLFTGRQKSPLELCMQLYGPELRRISGATGF